MKLHQVQQMISRDQKELARTERRILQLIEKANKQTDALNKLKEALANVIRTQ